MENLLIPIYEVQLFNDNQIIVKSREGIFSTEEIYLKATREISSKIFLINFQFRKSIFMILVHTPNHSTHRKIKPR